MLPGVLKPILSSLALPPAILLILIGLGLALVVLRRRMAGVVLAGIGTCMLWLLSCHWVATALAAALLPQVPAVTPERLAGVQAIVVLGGGVLRDAPEYGAPQPNSYSAARLRYAAWLARRTGKPLAFSGGVGWASVRGSIPPEDEAARWLLAQDYGLVPRWVDAASRDTHENAQRMRDLLGRDGVRRIALVTHSWHMPRAADEFEQAGFQVVPAPTGLPSPQVRPLLEWMPSTDGLTLSRLVIREAVARLVQPG
ncbi:YdcF family protein [Ramlibacter sp. MMS24-I3-19]|uniref:YdcF family protein n=1 Tax=Ramlibacter sp. MMS24-I3-19 TaxID=3416606 RepID=UPI003CFE3AF4